MKKQKICNLCGRKLPVSNFYKQKISGGGRVYRSRCKECYRQVTRDYYWAHRDVLLKRQRHHYKKRRPYLKNYYQTHREARLKYQREWYRKQRIAQVAARAKKERSVASR